MASPSTAPSRAGASLALTAVCLGFFMILLDGSALNIALPAVQRDMQGTLSGLQWIVTIYTIPLASLLLTAGNVGDRLGSRRLFVWSVGLFTLASLLCAASTALWMLIAARASQGIAAAGVLPTTLALIARTYPDPVERAKAITVWGAIGGLALVTGPIGGGVLTDLLGWRSIFVINLPIGLVTVALMLRYAHETPTRATHSLDLTGQLTGVIALSALVAGLIEGDALGWTSPATVGLVALSVVSGVSFVRVERGVRDPMLPMRMFRCTAFSASVTNGFAFQFAAYGMQFMLAIYVQEHWHSTAANTGLLFLPFSLCWVFGTIVLNRRLVHRGPRWLLGTGAAIAFVGALHMFGVTGAHTWLLFEAGTALIGLGCGLLGPSLAAAAMLSVGAAYAGLGSGVLNTARQLGMAVGIALLGAMLATGDLSTGMHLGMGVVALCFLSIVILSVRYVPRSEH